ncbi:hypothetical protein DPEC_G00234540 [Dallia pectoralis]|uniref:Uncharacterized protein n=1 Tax=Dallia pectoralis TaxID=75939 RepID=A0ACC2FY92_DALPE|nr:hypothetical protein DPEC_G00234540 [Dallia pectoralis]
MADVCCWTINCAFALTMEVTFSGWTAVEDKKLHSGEEPQNEIVYTMYHGTDLKHAQDIITNGLKRSTDGMLGPGVYVSRNIDKAKCYPLNADKKDKIVFKLKVRVGKVKKIDTDNHPLQKAWHQNGYDSCWVPPNSAISSIKSGREEDCVWDPARVLVVDVACCMDDQRRRDFRKQIQETRASRRGANNACDRCQQNTVYDQSHPIQSCWACTEQICPFQLKHPLQENQEVNVIALYCIEIRGNGFELLSPLRSKGFFRFQHKGECLHKRAMVLTLTPGPAQSY